MLNPGRRTTNIPHYVCLLKGSCLSSSLAVYVLVAIFPGEPGLAGFIGAKHDGNAGDHWSCETCKAVACSLSSCLEYFRCLGEGIDPCQRSDDNSANTALHVAARAGHHQIVLYLLQVNFFVGVIVAGPHSMHAGISHAHMNSIGCD